MKVLFLFLTVSTIATAETNWIDIMKRNRQSAVLASTALSKFMTQCVERVMGEGPTPTTPYVTAKQIFDDMPCKLNKCYQNATLLSFVAVVKGDDSKSQEMKQQAAVLAASFQRQECDGDVGIPPALLAMFLN